MARRYSVPIVGVNLANDLEVFSLLMGSGYAIARIKRLILSPETVSAYTAQNVPFYCAVLASPTQNTSGTNPTPYPWDPGDKASQATFYRGNTSPSTGTDSWAMYDGFYYNTGRELVFPGEGIIVPNKYLFQVVIDAAPNVTGGTPAINGTLDWDELGV